MHKHATHTQQHHRQYVPVLVSQHQGICVVIMEEQLLDMNVC